MSSQDTFSFRHSLDGIDVVRYEESLHWKGLLSVLERSFYPNECTTIATDIHLPGATVARADLDRLCSEVSRDAVSLVAVRHGTHQVLGFVLNKIQTAGTDFYGDFIREKCDSANAQALIQFMIDVDGKFDLFGHFGSECFFEIMFLGVLPEWERQSIGRTLCDCSLQLATAYREGRSEVVDGLPLQYRDCRPLVATSNFSSRHSQRIGERLGFETLFTFPYTDVEFEGRTFAERIGNPLHVSTTLVAKRL